MTTTQIIARDIEENGLRLTLRDLPELAKKRGARLAACEAYAQFYAVCGKRGECPLTDSEAATLRGLAAEVR